MPGIQLPKNKKEVLLRGNEDSLLQNVLLDSSSQLEKKNDESLHHVI